MVFVLHAFSVCTLVFVQCKSIDFTAHLGCAFDEQWDVYPTIFKKQLQTLNHFHCIIIYLYLFSFHYWLYYFFLTFAVSLGWLIHIFMLWETAMDLNMWIDFLVSSPPFEENFTGICSATIWRKFECNYKPMIKFNVLQIQLNCDWH